MDLNQIRKSGLLELYVLGDCSLAEQVMIEEAMQKYPELKKDLYEIGHALEHYAAVRKVKPSGPVKDHLFDRLQEAGHRAAQDAHKPPEGVTRSMGWALPLALLGLVALALGWYFSHRNTQTLQSQLVDQQVACDSLQQENLRQYATLEQLQDPGNRVLAFQPTGNFENTDLLLLYNEASRTNFIQVRGIPQITPSQSFQLWSLKQGQDPIPLTVFQGDEGLFIPVSFEEGTQTYAITIEPLGGSETPTLQNLIGTVAVS